MNSVTLWLKVFLRCRWSVVHLQMGLPPTTLRLLSSRGRNSSRAGNERVVGPVSAALLGSHHTPLNTDNRSRNLKRNDWYYKENVSQFMESSLSSRASAGLESFFSIFTWKFFRSPWSFFPRFDKKCARSCSCESPLEEFGQPSSTIRCNSTRSIWSFCIIQPPRVKVQPGGESLLARHVGFCNRCAAMSVDLKTGNLPGRMSLQSEKFPAEENSSLNTASYAKIFSCRIISLSSGADRQPCQGIGARRRKCRKVYRAGTQGPCWSSRQRALKVHR